MAAWGVTGIVGAGLALVWRGRTIGRWPLAIACGICGFAFTAVQDVGDWITYSDHSLRQLGVYVGQGLGFDAIYAGSCVVFALAFGPALLRSIQRFTKRLEITWLAPGQLGRPLLAVAVALVGAAPSPAAPGRRRRAAATDVLQRPVDYLLHAQNDDGGFGAEAGPPSSSAVRRLGGARAGVGRRAAAERRPRAGADRLHRARGGCHGRGFDRAQHPRRPRRRAERDRLRWPRPAGDAPHQIPRNGSVGGDVNLTTFGILALRAAGGGRAGADGRLAAGPAEPRRRLRVRRTRRRVGRRRHRRGAGGAGVAARFARRRGPRPSDRLRSPRSRTTTAVSHRNRGRAPTRSRPPGRSRGSTPPGEPGGVRHAGGPSPLAYLQSLIGRDGAVAYARGQKQTPVWVTGEVLMALAGKPLPLAPLAVPAAKPAGPRSRRLRRRHRARRTTRSSTSTTRSSTPKTPAGAAGHGAGARTASAAGRASVVRPACRFGGDGVRRRPGGRVGGDRGGRRDRDPDRRGTARADVTRNGCEPPEPIRSTAP